MCPTETNKNERLNAFRKKGHFCDMDIRIGTKVFRVHRVIVAAASEYFEKILLEHPDENTVTLREDEVDDADLFQEVVLPFIYTDDDNEMIEENNLVQVLRMSALLKIQNLENRCIQFIGRTNGKIPNMLNLFKSVTSLNKPSWTPVLSCCIMKHFHQYVNDSMILCFSFDEFKALLGARSFLSPRNEDTLLETIIKWYHYSEEKRREHFKELINSTTFPNISAHYIKCLLENFCLKTPSVENSPRQSTLYRGINQKCKPFKPNLGLHMYIMDDEHTIRVYSANKSTADWNVSSVKKFHKNDWIHSSLVSLELDDHLYSLDYTMNENTFNVRSDISFSSTVLPLKPPPVRMERFSMCSLQKSIYVSKYHRFWDWDEDFNIVQDVDKWAFNKEGITQGIFEYNIVVDKWFPVPQLVDDKLDGSAVTADNKVLYLIDGEMDPTSETFHESYVNISALDVRTSKWQKLTKNVTAYGGSSATLGCAHDGKIYVCPAYGDYKKPGVVIGIYDLKANRWGKFQRVNRSYEINQLLFYKNNLWAFGLSARNLLCEIEVFDPVTQVWSQSPFSNVNRVTEYGSRNTHFKNAFIFKSTLL